MSRLTFNIRVDELQKHLKLNMDINQFDRFRILGILHGISMYVTSREPRLG